MIESMEECGPPITSADIESVESRIGIRLPADYKAFLLKYNGGRPTPNAFPIEGLANNPFGGIQVFFGIDDPIDSCNLDSNYEIVSGSLPTNLLAIACNGGGDLICLSLYGDDAGAVLFWDSHHDQPYEPNYDHVYKIADSFPEFLESIQEVPLDDA